MEKYLYIRIGVVIALANLLIAFGDISKGNFLSAGIMIGASLIIFVLIVKTYQREEREAKERETNYARRSS
jgi:hypothetical protein